MSVSSKDITRSKDLVLKSDNFEEKVKPWVLVFLSRVPSSLGLHPRQQRSAPLTARGPLFSGDLKVKSLGD